MLKFAFLAAAVLQTGPQAPRADPVAHCPIHSLQIQVSEYDASGNEKVLANPTLSTPDGRPMFFNVVGQVAVKAADGSEQFMHTGVSVRLTPKRAANGKLSVAMEIETSSVEKEGDPLRLHTRRVDSLCEDVEANGIYLELQKLGSAGLRVRVRVHNVEERAKEAARLKAFKAKVRVFEVATDGSEKPVCQPQLIFTEDAPARFHAGAEPGARQGKPGIPVGFEFNMKILRLYTGKRGVQVQACLERETDRNEAEFATRGRCAKVIRELRNGEPFSFKLDSPVDGSQTYRIEVAVEETDERPGTVKTAPTPVLANPPLPKE